MSLTKDDLAAIRDIVETVVEDAKQQTAAGFEEVHQKFEEVHQKIDDISSELSETRKELGDKIDNLHKIVMSEVKRVDEHSGTISNIRKQLKAV